MTARFPRINRIRAVTDRAYRAIVLLPDAEGALTGAGRIARPADGDYLIAGTVKSPNRQLRDRRNSGRIAAATERNSGGEEIRPLNDDIPGAYTTIGLSGNIYTIRVDIVFRANRIKYGEDQRYFRTQSVKSTGNPICRTLRYKDECRVPCLVLRFRPRTRAGDLICRDLRPVVASRAAGAVQPQYNRVRHLLLVAGRDEQPVWHGLASIPVDPRDKSVDDILSGARQRAGDEKQCNCR